MRERAGTLYLIATPIGNLGDMTARALDTLRSVHHVAAEDTRRTRGLLSHFGITGKPLSTLDANAGEHAVARLVARLTEGEDVAFVSDAGTPGVSDPGAALVRAAAAAGVHVTSLPGASAVTTAVALSGVVGGPFVFSGFLPRSGGHRDAALERIRTEPLPIVLFEAPHRMAETLVALAERCPEREAVVCRELTKLHEEVLRGTLRELSADSREWLGEIVVVLGAQPDVVPGPSEQELRQRALRLLEAGASVKAIAEELSYGTPRSRRELYALVQAVKGETAPPEE